MVGSPAWGFPHQTLHPAPEMDARPFLTLQGDPPMCCKCCSVGSHLPAAPRSFALPTALREEGQGGKAPPCPERAPLLLCPACSQPRRLGEDSHCRVCPQLPEAEAACTLAPMALSAFEHDVGMSAPDPQLGPPVQTRQDLGG